MLERIAKLEVKVDHIDWRLGQVEGRLDRMEGKIDEIGQKLDKVVSTLSSTATKAYAWRTTALVGFGAVTTFAFIVAYAGPLRNILGVLSGQP